MFSLQNRLAVHHSYIIQIIMKKMIQVWIAGETEGFPWVARSWGGVTSDLSSAALSLWDWPFFFVSVLFTCGRVTTSSGCLVGLWPSGVVCERCLLGGNHRRILFGRRSQKPDLTSGVLAQQPGLLLSWRMWARFRTVIIQVDSMYIVQCRQVTALARSSAGTQIFFLVFILHLNSWVSYAVHVSRTMKFIY